MTLDSDDVQEVCRSRYQAWNPQVLPMLIAGGDGSPVTCDTPMSSGSGTRPDAVTVDPGSCAIEGEPTEDEFGTWVWITEVEQSGARAYVPFCITQDTPAAGSFDVSMRVGDDSDALLAPLLGTFAPGEPLAVGPEDDDPWFEVVGGCGDAACYYGWVFQLGASPFGGDCGQDSCLGLSPSQLLSDDDGPIGFAHGLHAHGPPVDAGFEGRPFVLPWNLTYCIADNDTACDGSEAVLANAGARLHVSVLMLPE